MKANEYLFDVRMLQNSMHFSLERPPQRAPYRPRSHKRTFGLKPTTQPMNFSIYDNLQKEKILFKHSLKDKDKDYQIEKIESKLMSIKKE